MSPFRPADLVRIPEPFDHGDFIFELKHDGFRAVAHITPKDTQLVSRRGNIYKSFRPLSASLRELNCDAILDGEIVVLDETGKPQFYELLRRRGEPVFYAFDCLMLNGRDQHRARIAQEHPAGMPSFLEQVAQKDLQFHISGQTQYILFGHFSPSGFG